MLAPSAQEWLMACWCGCLLDRGDHKGDKVGRTIAGVEVVHEVMKRDCAGGHQGGSTGACWVHTGGCTASERLSVTSAAATQGGVRFDSKCAARSTVLSLAGWMGSQARAMANERDVCQGGGGAQDPWLTERGIKAHRFLVDTRALPWSWSTHQTEPLPEELECLCLPRSGTGPGVWSGAGVECGYGPTACLSASTRTRHRTASPAASTCGTLPVAHEHAP
eukprot:1140322-Pelagomonas_calceolata.AAC.5